MSKKKTLGSVFARSLIKGFTEEVLKEGDALVEIVNLSMATPEMSVADPLVFNLGFTFTAGRGFDFTSAIRYSVCIDFVIHRHEKTVESQLRVFTREEGEDKTLVVTDTDSLMGLLFDLLETTSAPEEELSLGERGDLMLELSSKVSEFSGEMVKKLTTAIS